MKALGLRFLRSRPWPGKDWPSCRKPCGGTSRPSPKPSPGLPRRRWSLGGALGESAEAEAKVSEAKVLGVREHAET